MRTVGTFEEIYAAARDFHHGDRSDMPMSPVVRLESGKWMIESELEPAQDCDFEISLAGFNDWFYEMYNSSNIPSDSDISDFMDCEQ